jgi:ABC-type transport system substrate-binding protein
LGDRLRRDRLVNVLSGLHADAADRRQGDASKQFPPAGWNTSRYVNPRVDTLVEQARRSLNQTEREKLYGEVQDILGKEMVWIPVYTTKEIIVSRAGVKGFQIHPVEYNLWLGKAWLDK